jgi:hypothetical protein
MQDSTYVGIIPIGFNTPIGVEYIIRAWDNYGVMAQLGPLTLKCSDITIMIDPDTIPVYFANAVIPMKATIYLGNLSGAYSVNDIVQNTVRVNSSISPISVSIEPSFPGFAGEVMKIEIAIEDLIETYGLLWDTTVQTFIVSGEFNDNVSYSEPGNIVFIGHRSGDVNNDGKVNIHDIAYLLNFLYQGGPAPVIEGSGDVNGSGATNLKDVSFIIRYLYKGGPKPNCTK